MATKKLTAAEQVAKNIRLWRFYPIGMVTSMWAIFESLRPYLDDEEKKALDKVDDALEKLNQLIRKNRHSRD